MAPRTTQQFEEIRSERKAQILDAALHVFAEEGYHNSSVSRIAKHAGISKGLMYNYFDSKDDVLKALMIDLFDYAMDMLKIVPGEIIDDERFEELISLSVRVPIEEPQKWKLYMSLAFQKDVTEILMAEMQPRMAPYIEAMMTYFTATGDKDPMATLRIFSALLDGVQMHCLLDPVGFPAKKAEEFLIKQFVK